MNPKIEKIISFFKNSISEIQATYAEKGIEPFKKPIMYSVPIFLVIYFGFYSPSINKVSTLKDEIARYELLAPLYGDYTNYKNSLSQYKKNLPLYKDKDEWLDYIITTNCKKNGVSPQSIGAQIESELTGGFVLASKDISIEADYFTVGKLVADMENSQIFVKITELNLKKGSVLGTVSVQFKIATVFIKPGS